MWVEDVSNFKVGDSAKIETGYQYPLVDTHELVTIREVYPLGRIKVNRAEESRPIPDQTPISIVGRYKFTVKCVQNT